MNSFEGVPLRVRSHSRGRSPVWNSLFGNRVTGDRKMLTQNFRICPVLGGCKWKIQIVRYSRCAITAHGIQNGTAIAWWLTGWRRFTKAIRCFPLVESGCLIVPVGCCLRRRCPAWLAKWSWLFGRGSFVMFRFVRCVVVVALSVGCVVSGRPCQSCWLNVLRPAGCSWRWLSKIPLWKIPAKHSFGWMQHGNAWVIVRNSGRFLAGYVRRKLLTGEC